MMEKKKNSIDMTHGALWNKILIFALPLAASSILQQLFNSVDTAVVGNFASSQALAAVGSNSSLIALMINLLSVFHWVRMLLFPDISVRVSIRISKQPFTLPLWWLWLAAFSCWFWDSLLQDR